MRNLQFLILVCFAYYFVSCTTLGCGVKDYCIGKEQISEKLYAPLKQYVDSNKNHAFVLLTSTFFDFDSVTINKKVFDFFMIAPNYCGLIDSTGIKRKYSIPDDYVIAYDAVVKNKVAPRKYPLLHCHIGEKIVFIQSTIDDFVSSQNSIDLFRQNEIYSTDGRHQFMRESMCIIKQPDGEVNSFIVGDTILTEDKLRMYFNRHL